MRALVQRATRASVTVEGETIGAINDGFLILLGVGHEDTEAQADKLWSKISKMRIFEDENGKTNLSLADVHGEVLVVSQFTLMASYKKGNRPSYIRAAGHEHAIPLYEYFCQTLSTTLGKDVQTGTFGADMKVELLNDGPVTICMDTKNKE